MVLTCHNKILGGGEEGTIYFCVVSPPVEVL